MAFRVLPGGARVMISSLLLALFGNFPAFSEVAVTQEFVMADHSDVPLFKYVTGYAFSGRVSYSNVALGHSEKVDVSISFIDPEYPAFTDWDSDGFQCQGDLELRDATETSMTFDYKTDCSPKAYTPATLEFVMVDPESGAAKINWTGEFRGMPVYLRGDVRNEELVGRAEQKLSEEMDPCFSAAWDGILNNMADLFLCDPTRAIGNLASGREISFVTESIGFNNGSITATAYSRASFVEEIANSIRKDGLKTWNDSLAVSQSRNFQVICIFEKGASPNLSAGSNSIVHATLQDYSGDRIVLKCSQ